jgi:MFS family permease
MFLIILFSQIAGLVIGLVMLNLPPVIDELLPLYNVSYGGASFLLSALLWSHAGIQLPGGMIADYLGIRRTLLISVGLMLAGCLISSLWASLELAIIARIIAGLGTGLSFIVIMKMIAVTLPSRRVGVFQGLFGGTFSLGSVLAFMFLPRLAESGWRWIYLSVAIPSLITLCMVPFLKLKKGENREFNRVSPRSIMAIRSAWVIGVFHAFSYGSVVNIATWIPSVLSEMSKGTTASDFAWLGGLVLLTSGISRFCGGFILLWFRDLDVAIRTIFLLCLFYAIMMFITKPCLMIVLVVLVSFFASINFGAFWQLAGKLASQESLGTAFGFVNLLANIGTAGFTIMFGYFKESTGTFLWGFGTMSVLIFMTLVSGGPILMREVAVIQERNCNA